MPLHHKNISDRRLYEPQLPEASVTAASLMGTWDQIAAICTSHCNCV